MAMDSAQSMPTIQGMGGMLNAPRLGGSAVSIKEGAAPQREFVPGEDFQHHDEKQHFYDVFFAFSSKMCAPPRRERCLWWGGGYFDLSLPSHF